MLFMNYEKNMDNELYIIFIDDLSINLFMVIFYFAINAIDLFYLRTNNTIV